MNKKIIILAVALLHLCSDNMWAKMKLVDASKRKQVSEWRQNQQTNYFYEGKQHLLVGDARKAYKSFSIALWADPYCDACYYEISGLLRKPSEAVVAAENAYRLDTTNYWYIERCANLFAQADRYADAEQFYWKCLAIKPRNADVYEELSQLYMRGRQYDKQLAMLDYYEQYFGEDATSLTLRQQAYYKMGEHTKSAEQAALLSEKYPSTQKYHLLAAELYMLQNQDSIAYLYLQEAGRIDSNSVDYQMSIADYWRRSEDFNRYFGVLQQIFVNPMANMQGKLYLLEFLQQFPQFTTIYAEEIAGLYKILLADSVRAYAADWLFVQFLLQNRLWNEAKLSMQMTLERTTRLPPPSRTEQGAVHKISLTLFSLLSEQGQWDSIVATADRYVNFLPNKYFAYYFKAFALTQKEDYAAAKIAALAAVKNVEPNDTASFAQIYAILGDISFNLKEYSQCDKFYEQALGYAPNNALFMNNYAYYLSLRGKKLRKALNMSAKTLLQAPTNATFLDTYAWILFKQKRYEEAKQIFRKAIMYNGDKEYAILEHYGDVLYELGEKDNAVIYWKRSLEQGNPSVDLSKKIGER
jgi:tetratricopeptide (TPR) repeat protein